MHDRGEPPSEDAVQIPWSVAGAAMVGSPVQIMGEDGLAVDDPIAYGGVDNLCRMG